MLVRYLGRSVDCERRRIRLGGIREAEDSDIRRLIVEVLLNKSRLIGPTTTRH
jgi:hypothetical protein